MTSPSCVSSPADHPLNGDRRCHYIARRGVYYRGSVYGTDADWTADLGEAFRYGSVDVAIDKIAKFPTMFDGCHVATF